MDLEKLQQLAKTAAQPSSFSEVLAEGAITRANAQVGRARAIVRSVGFIAIVSTVAAFTVLSGGANSQTPIQNPVASADTTAPPAAFESPNVINSVAPHMIPGIATPAMNGPTPSMTSAVPGLPTETGEDQERSERSEPSEALTTPTVEIPATAKNASGSAPLQPSPPSLTAMPLSDSSAEPLPDSSTAATPAMPSPSNAPEPGTSPSQPEPDDNESEVAEPMAVCGVANIKAELLPPEVTAEGRASNALQLHNVSDKPCRLTGVLSAQVASGGSEPKSIGGAITLDYIVDGGGSFLLKVSYNTPSECRQTTGTVTMTISGLGDYVWPNSYLDKCPAGN